MPRHHLSEYRRKRQAGRTPEPFGGGNVTGLFRYVIQKHAARRLHYDFRLEWQGVLKSWAVPRGPSLDPKVKRLAVHVEDHPLEYAYFEGVIPPDNYGAGQVIVWDLGVWVPLEDPEHGLEHGKLLFELHGYKLRGVWTLVRTQADWLLIKKPDGFARPDAGDSAFDETSVLSGMTVQQRETPVDPGHWQKLLGERGLHSSSYFEVPTPMLARTAPAPFTRPGWLFELKYDGFRLIAARQGKAVRLIYRRGLDASIVYPELVQALAAWPVTDIVVDGELVATDDAGMPSFIALQNRALLQTPQEILSASVRAPVVYYVFDLLMLDGVDLRKLPLVERKALLQPLVPSLGPIRYADHIAERGEAFFAKVAEMGLEGIIAKQANSVYRSGRSDAWLKMPAYLHEEFAIVGFTAPAGTRSGFGALQVAQQQGEGLVYVGAVGTGFTEQTLHEVHAKLLERVRKTPPCAVKTALPADITWVEPTLACQVRYKEITRDGLLRQAAFLAMGSREPTPPPEPVAPERGSFVPSHLDKVFWPQEGYTKGDLLAYYEAVAPWLLVYLRDRPLTLTRYPDGITGKSFFQKDAPEWTPPWVRTVRLWSESTAREIDFFVCDDVQALLYVINLGTIPLHVGASRVGSPGQPDWCVLDLDPKDAPFAHVIELAREIYAICKKIGMPSFVKTSGSTGLHVMLPSQGTLTHDQSRRFAELLARVVVERRPDIATVVRAVGARGGKVYIDTGQNGHGRLIAAPLTARPVPGALVSTPLHWREVRPGLDFRRFTIKTVPPRLARAKADPLVGVLNTAVDWVHCLTQLEHLVT